MREQTTPFHSRVIVVDRTVHKPGDSTPVGFGLNQVIDSLATADVATESRDYWTTDDDDPVVVVGKTDDQLISTLLQDPPTRAESIVYQWVETDGRSGLVVAGTDERGLMYALLELSDRIQVDGIEALNSVENAVETPDNDIRGVDRFLMGPPEDEWFYETDFWEYYLRRLAKARFNRFVLITGHDTAFMSPPYPFFVDVPDYPQVTVRDTIDVTRDDHLELLRTIGDICHQYGLDFFFGTWQQRPRSINTDFDDHAVDQGFLVEGLPLDDSDAFTDYCYQGLKLLLAAVPQIDGVQLRVNYESGVGDRSTAEQFWKKILSAPAAANDRRDHPVKLDIRAKGCTDNMIQWALDTGVDVTVSTKYWCESTGLPYHNTQMRRGELDNLQDMNMARRYSYSDLLEEPRVYDMMYRLWAVGTNRIFLWGDPDYAQRFSESAGFGGSNGFEILSPLGLKGGHYGIQEAWPLFDDPDLRHYDYEDERYWAWYLFFGRLGYSRETSSAVWEREFDTRFGGAGSDVLTAYRAASKILPLLTASHLTKHPTLHNWAELDTGGSLFTENNFNPVFTEVTYGSAEPSDPAMFYGIEEYVDDVLSAEHEGKYTPLQVAEWYDTLADEARDAIEAANSAIDTPTDEFRTTSLDISMLADLAAYHGEKTRSAVALAFYEADGSLSDLQDAFTFMERARDNWASLAERGDGTYHDNLLFAMGAEYGDEGNWSDRLEEMEADISTLRELVHEEGVDEIDGSITGRVPEISTGVASLQLSAPCDLDLPVSHPQGEELIVTAKFNEIENLSRSAVTLHYRHNNQLEGEFEKILMTDTSRGYRAEIPEEYLSAEWNLLVYVTAVTDDGHGVVAPGIYHPSEEAPYVEVNVTQT